MHIPRYSFVEVGECVGRILIPERRLFTDDVLDDIRFRSRRGNATSRHTERPTDRARGVTEDVLGFVLEHAGNPAAGRLCAPR